MGSILPLLHLHLAPREDTEASDLGPFHLLTILEISPGVRLLLEILHPIHGAKTSTQSGLPRAHWLVILQLFQ